MPAPDDTAAPKWTPGPWHFNSELLRVRTPTDPPITICGIHRSSEAIVNGRLIAAAPSLYEALSRLVDRYHPYRDNHDDRDWASAVAALALARGEQ